MPNVPGVRPPLLPQPLLPPRNPHTRCKRAGWQNEDHHDYDDGDVDDGIGDDQFIVGLVSFLGYMLSKACCLN